ncbi:hypothetical protein [Halorarum halobium]|uniref:hypothetical protein n=1 Tax=Halorarum halobium TaxID=3075121 RepID=UPI0028B02F97|nr:hypothetical protein [Halobaculum sp. XH14]
MQGISLVDIGLEWFEDVIDWVIEWFNRGITDGYAVLSESLLGTPTPESSSGFVFGSPTNEPWIALHDSLVGGDIQLIALLLLVVCVQGRHTIRIFNIGSRYEAQRAKRTAWTGAILIVAWYWVGALSLYLVDGFTIALIPDVSAVTDAMVEFLRVSISNPALALVLAIIGGIAMWTLQALLFIRELLLYVYLYGMPLAVALTYGNIPVVSRIASALSLKFVPLALMPLPVAILFKAYELLFSEGIQSTLAPTTAFLSTILAVSLPVLAVLVVWKVFKYASPLTTAVIGTTSGAAVTAGTIITAGAVGGPTAATTAARWGSKAAAGHVTAQRVASGGSGTGHTGARQGTSSSPTQQDALAPESTRRSGAPSYRRTENDPGHSGDRR